MRIVMVTGDLEIDRRIISQANSLIQLHHEVILLAGYAKDRPQFEKINQIKIERINGNIILLPNKYKDLLRTVKILFCRVLKRIKNKFFYNLKIRKVAYKPKIEARSNSYKSAFISLLSAQMIVFQNILGILIITLNHLIRFLLFLSRKLLLKGLLGFSIGLHRANPSELLLIHKICHYQPDIIQIHDLPFLRAGTKAKKKLNVPLIYDAHEFYPEQPRLTVEQQTYLRNLEKKQIYQANVIITVNEFIARKMEQAYPGTTIQVIQNAIDPPVNFDIQHTYNKFRQEYHLSEDSILVLFQGYIGRERNLEVAISSMKYLRNTRFVLLIMGYGEESYIEALKNIAKENAIENQVIFVPCKNQQELLFYTASADIGLIPYPHNQDINTTYVSPNKLYEFIVAGIPILANELPFVKKIIEENHFGICTDIQTPELLAQAIQQFPLAKIKEFKQNILSGRYQFTWQAEAKKFLELYAPFLSGKKQKLIDEKSLAAPLRS